MPNGKMYTKAFKALMVQRVREGESRKDLCEAYGIATSSLANWCSQSNPYSPGRRSKEPTMAEVRSSLAMMDGGIPMEDVIDSSRRKPETVRAWLTDPKYREATWEYDPEMTYDYYDLTDRSIVTHHLCTQTLSKDERLEFLAALVAPTVPVPA